MKDRPRIGGILKGAAATLVLLAIAGCGDEPGGNIIVVPGEPAAKAPKVATSAPAAAPPMDFSQDRIEQGVTPPPAAPPGPFLVNNVRRTFVDPPLPPELNDDGGLKPLPTRRR